jgi:hypothetical protein
VHDRRRRTAQLPALFRPVLGCLGAGTDHRRGQPFEFVDEPLRDDAGKARRTAVRDAAVERLRGA